MPVGRVEVSPDYKSKRPSTGLIFVDEPGAIHRAAELARLEREVIEASKAERKAERAAQVPDDYDVAQARRRSRAAADALLSFEAEQKK